MKIVRLSQLIFDEISLVTQVPIKNAKDRPEADNKWRKLLFFIKAEGLTRTIAKIKSKKDKRFLVEKFNTIVVVKINNRTFANFSIQTSKEINNFVLNNAFYHIEKAEHLEYKNVQYNQYIESFDVNDEQFGTSQILQCKNLNTSKLTTHNEGVFIYGLGDYSRVYIAPNIKKLKKIFCVDYISSFSEYYKTKYNYINYGLVPQDSYDQIKRVKKPLAIIATYHSDHTRIVNEIFNINPETIFFIEKPPCVTLSDIETLIGLYKKGAKIEIGYNRRFIKVNQNLKSKLKGEKAIINISVKEILINQNHWYFWKNQGTRITGNLTHWIDLSNYWLEDEIPVELNMLKSTTKDETFTVSILYSKGSLVNLSVSDKGSTLRGVQEKIEIRTESETYFIDDYLKNSVIDKHGVKRSNNKMKRLKGHDNMYKHIVNVFQDKAPFKYNVEELIKTTLTTYYLSYMFENDIKNFKIKDIITNHLQNI